MKLLPGWSILPINVLTQKRTQQREIEEQHHIIDKPLLWFTFWAKKKDYSQFPIFFSHIFPYVLCLVVLSHKCILCLMRAALHGYCQNPRQKDDEGHDESEDECLPLCWRHVKMSMHPIVFPLCLKRPKEKHVGPEHDRSKCPNTQNNTRSYSELCPCICDICCTCVYFKGLQKRRFDYHVSRAAILYL